jgi:hypothetical protein
MWPRREERVPRLTQAHRACPVDGHYFAWVPSARAQRHSREEESSLPVRPRSAVDPYCDPTPTRRKATGKQMLIEIPYGTTMTAGSGASDELLPAVDVVRRTVERGVDHEVYRECRDVGGAHDATDRQRGPQRAPALLELISQQ